MAKYFYQIDTDLTNGQETYDMLVDEKSRHGVVPVAAVGSLWNQPEGSPGITTNKAVEIDNDLNVTGITTSSIYSVSGIQTGIGTTATRNIDASNTQMIYHTAGIADTSISTLTFYVSNLKSGRSVNVFVKNSGSVGLQTVTVSLQASTTSSGHVGVGFANQGSASTSSFVLHNPNGTASIWAANMDGNFVATLS